MLYGWESYSSGGIIMARTISITDNRTGKTTYHTFPKPKAGEKANSMDLDEGDIFESRGELYKVTGHEDIGCLARPLNTENWDGIEILFPCEIVTYKGR